MDLKTHHNPVRYMASKRTQWWHSGLLLIWILLMIAFPASSKKELNHEPVFIKVKDDSNVEAFGHYISILNSTKSQVVNLQCNPGSEDFEVSSRIWKINGESSTEEILKLEITGNESLVECLARSPEGLISYSFAYVSSSYELEHEENIVKIRANPEVVLEGGAVTFACEGAERFEWLKNGEIFSDVEVIEEDRKTTIEIPYMLRNDTAIYGCKAIESGKPVGYAEVYVPVNFIPLLDIIPPDTSEVNSTNDLVLRCGAKGKPLPVINWFAGDEAVVCDDGRCDATLDTAKNSVYSDLVLHNLTSGNNYSCVASNDVGKIGASTVVRVHWEVPQINHLSEVHYTLLEDELNVRCTADGWPDPEVYWERNGVVISPSGVLEIVQFSKEDEGTYVCVATNLHGNDTLEIDVYGTLPIRAHHEGDQRTVDAGSGTSLNCSAFVDEKLDVERSWFKNGKELERYKNKEVLLIPWAIVQDHRGEYVCRIQTSFESVEIQWNVEVNFRIPKVKKNYVEVFVMEGDDIQVPCEVEEGLPKPKLEWRLKDKILGDGILQLKGIQRDEEGLYNCIAVNEYGSSTMKAKVNVLNETEVDLRSSSSSWEPDTMSDLELICDYTTDKRINSSKVIWTKDSSDLNEETNKLSLKTLRLSDSGNYQCKVVTKFSAKSESKELKVKGVSPSFMFSSENVKVLEGSNATLICQANGLPIPTISWNKEISGRFAQGPLGDLKITNVTLADEGVYKCAASNLYGSISTKISVIVIKKLAGDASFEELNANFGDNVTLNCNVNVDPRIKHEVATSWSRIENDDVVQLNNDIDKYHILKNGSLIINHVDGSDMSNYQCTLKTSFENISQEVSLVIYGEPPKVLSAFSEIKALGSTSTKLNCSYSGIPKPKVSWLRNNVVISGENDLTLTIKDLKMEDSGNYSCQVSNDYGSSLGKIANVKVLRPTSVFISDEDLQVKAGSPLNIPCNFSYDGANVVTAVRWQKDGLPIELVTKDAIDYGLDGSITIINPQKRHEGTYKCIINTNYDVVSSTVDVKVIVNAPVISRHSKDQVVFTGDSVALLCKANGIPEPKITWRFNNTQTEVVGNEFRIMNSMITDLGRYRCIATNQYGETSQEINFEVVPLTPWPKNYLIEEGRNFELPCIDETKHRGISIVWKKDDQVIDVPPPGSLQLRNISHNDTGRYSCTLMSRVSERRKVLKTNVGLKRKLIVSSGGKLKYLKGESLTLECNVMPDIRAKRLWKFNGEFFLETERKSIFQDGQYLKISGLRTSDGGNYTCVASSSEIDSNGRDSITFNVEVIDEPKQNAHGCDTLDMEYHIGIDDISAVDNFTGVIAWSVPPDFNQSCYDSFNLVWWSKESQEYYERYLNLEQREIILKDLNYTLTYYVQINLVTLGASRTMEGYTRSFCLEYLIKHQKIKIDNSGAKVLYDYGLTIILVTVAVSSMAFFVICLVIYKRGCCAEMCDSCFRSKSKDDDRHFGKTNFNGFDSNTYHSAIIPLDVGGNGFTSPTNAVNPSNLMLRSNNAPQWPEPEVNENQNNTMSTYDENDPFLQRCSSFSPDSSSSNIIIPMAQPRRQSKTSIGSSWSSLFNVPVATTKQFGDLPTTSMPLQHQNSKLPKDSTFSPRKHQNQS